MPHSWLTDALSRAQRAQIFAYFDLLSLMTPQVPAQRIALFQPMSGLSLQQGRD